MLPTLTLGTLTLPMYYVALFSGVLVSGFIYVASEVKGRAGRRALWVGLRALGEYAVLVVVCLQGAGYFHFVFDRIPSGYERPVLDILFSSHLMGAKVLYGAVFFFPLAVLIATLPRLKGRCSKVLNQRTIVLLIVLAFARIGCLLHGCCFGVPSPVLGITYRADSYAAYEYRLRGLPPNTPTPPLFPVQPIEAGVLFGLAFLSWRAARLARRDIYLRYVGSYAVARFLLEFLRDDRERAQWGLLSASQWISLAFLLSILIYLYGRRRWARVAAPS